MLALAEEEQHDVGALDIKAAFLNAALDDELDPVYLVRPPHVLVRLGLISPKSVLEAKEGLVCTQEWPREMG